MSNDLTPPRHFLRPGFRTFGAVLSVALLFMSTPAPGATKVGTATKVVKDVYGTSLNRRMKPGEALVFNQKVRTGSESVANLSFLDDSTLVVGPRAEITLDEFVFDPEANIVRGSFKVVRGLMRFASGTTKLDISVKTPVVIIGIRGTAFDFLVTKGETEIVVREGTVEVTSRDGTDTLNEGEVMSVSRREGAVRKRAISKQMNVELTHTFKLLGTTSKQHLVEWLAERRKAKTEEQPVQKASVSATADQEVTQNEKENLLYLDLKKGRVVIELKPSFAPKHVARIRELVRQGFYNGLIFHSVVAKQVAVTGDPTGTGRGGTGQTQANELSTLPFIRGSVGMMPTRSDPNSTDSQIFICTGRMRQLDGKYTLLGQVVTGMEFIDALNTGLPPKTPDQVVRLQVAADAKEK